MKRVLRTFGLVSIAFLFLNVFNVFAQAKTSTGFSMICRNLM